MSILSDKCRDFLTRNSLNATILRSRISSAMYSSASLISEPTIGLVAKMDTIFTHPTVSQLASYLAGAIAQPDGVTFVPGHNSTAAIESMLNNYSRDLPRCPGLSDRVVLLTGSTGHLGSHLLHSLLGDPRVTRIYALNRPSSSATIAERQAAAFSVQAFSTRLLALPKLHLMEAEVHKEHLGLSQELFEQVRCITHVAINNLMFRSFEPQ